MKHIIEVKTVNTVARHRASSMTRRAWVTSLLLLAFGVGSAAAWEVEPFDPPDAAVEAAVPLSTFVIERNIPGAGKWSPQELRDISRKSRDVLEKLGPSIQWVQSYVVDDKVYCVYQAPDKELIARHAAEAGFPADRISEVKNIISLKTAE